MLDDEVVLIDIEDSPGVEEYTALRRAQIQASDACILCFSITDRKGFEELPACADEIFRVKDADWFPIVIAGCKGDREEERQVIDDEARQYAQSLRAEYVLTSAKEDVNVAEVFHLVARAARRGPQSPVQAERRGKDAKQFFEKTNCILQ
eukprot:TRINITY_DN2075_c0_g1_i5.p3 TRINITY_DN2075_c0_g1~~TRINITY_DN2075_c0_g1_i5.p3  ORF type:complete len:150 (-),score=27.35 TRINITY_DN2075_c0_g1_i5:1656-2105(-)